MKFLILGLAVLISGCGASGGGSSSGGIVGLDLSGTYRHAYITCFNAERTMITVAGTLTPASASSTLIISGNDLTEEIVGDGSCKVIQSRKVTFNLETKTATGGSGSGLLGQSTADVTTGSSCSGTIEYDTHGDAMSPASASATYTDNQPISAHNFYFMYGPAAVGIVSVFKPAGRPTDFCVSEYEKL